MAWLRKVVLLGAGTALSAFLVVQLTRPERTPQPVPSVPEDGDPLDAYPGFGGSPTAAHRDDAIALWEAYRGEALMAECMGSSGFVYKPEYAFVPGGARDVSAYLDLEIVSKGRFNPEGWNQRYIKVLSPERLDGYYRALLGESAEDMQYLHESGGRTPPGRPPRRFAQGGCYGDAREAIPSIWDAPRSLVGQLDRLHSLAGGDPEAFIARNLETLEAQQRRYSNAATEMKADEAFLRWLSTTAGA